MKTTLFTGLAAALLFSVSCGENGTNAGDSIPGDPTSTSVSTKLPQHLEDFLTINSEAQLKSMYGADRITWDTIWGAEGTFELGTYLDAETADAVMIFWGDPQRSSPPLSVAVETNGETYGKWASRTGVKLGMTLEDLEKLNGKPFVFSGFGWDYGGGVMDWKGGKLAEQQVNVGLSEENTQNLSEPEMNEVFGDKEVMSNNATARKVQPRVARLSVYRSAE